MRYRVALLMFCLLLVSPLFASPDTCNDDGTCDADESRPSCPNDCVIANAQKRDLLAFLDRTVEHMEVKHISLPPLPITSFEDNTITFTSDPGTQTALVDDFADPKEGTQVLRVQYTDPTDPNAIVNMQLPTSKDVSAYTGFSFWLYGDGSNATVHTLLHAPPETPGEQENFHMAIEFPVDWQGWKKIYAPFSAGSFFPEALTRIDMIQIGVKTPQEATLYFDDFRLEDFSNGRINPNDTSNWCLGDLCFYEMMQHALYLHAFLYANKYSTRYHDGALFSKIIDIMDHTVRTQNRMGDWYSSSGRTSYLLTGGIGLSLLKAYALLQDTPFMDISAELMGTTQKRSAHYEAAIHRAATRISATLDDWERNNQFMVATIFMAEVGQFFSNAAYQATTNEMIDHLVSAQTPYGSFPEWGETAEEIVKIDGNYTATHLPLLAILYKVTENPKVLTLISNFGKLLEVLVDQPGRIHFPQSARGHDDGDLAYLRGTFVLMDITGSPVIRTAYQDSFFAPSDAPTPTSWLTDVGLKTSYLGTGHWTFMDPYNYIYFTEITADATFEFIRYLPEYYYDIINGATGKVLSTEHGTITERELGTMIWNLREELTPEEKKKGPGTVFFPFTLPEKTDGTTEQPPPSPVEDPPKPSIDSLYWILGGSVPTAIVLDADVPDAPAKPAKPAKRGGTCSRIIDTINIF